MNQDIKWIKGHHFIVDEFVDVKVDIINGGVDVDHQLSNFNKTGYSIIFIDGRTGEIMELVYEDSDEPKYIVKFTGDSEVECETNSYTEVVDFITDKYRGE